jgi:hypothetical protein
VAKISVATDIVYAAASCGPPVAYAMVAVWAGIEGLAALSAPFVEGAVLV